MENYKESVCLSYFCAYKNYLNDAIFCVSLFVGICFFFVLWTGEDRTCVEWRWSKGNGAYWCVESP